MNFIEAPFLFRKNGYNTARLERVGAQTLARLSPLSETQNSRSLERLYRDAASFSIMPPQADFCKDMVGMLELGVDPREVLLCSRSQDN
jgi:hypothetical protein